MSSTTWLLHPGLWSIIWGGCSSGLWTKKNLISLNERLEKFLDIAEKQLFKTNYLAGNFYSMVDLNIAPSLHRVMVLHPELINYQNNVKAWYNVITSRPAFKKMLEADEGWNFLYGPFTNEET